LGKLDQPGIEGEVVDGLPAEREDRGWHHDVHDEDGGGHDGEEPLPRPDTGGDAPKGSPRFLAQPGEHGILLCGRSLPTDYRGGGAESHAPSRYAPGRRGTRDEAGTMS